MPILTEKEYAEKKKPGPVAEKQIAPVVIQEPESNVEYVLFYPDNVPGRYHNGKYKIGEKEYEIVYGIIRVTDKAERDKLVRDGFLFLRSEVKHG